MSGIARFSVVALDCPDPAAMARFYAAVTGWEVASGHSDEWEQLDPPDGRGASLAFQQVEDFRPPDWPGAEHPQQAHLDFEVSDLDRAEEQVLELGARRHPVQPGKNFRVYLDPAGHPFCLVRE